jgi:glycyl-tRNA synthetase alpha subunit
MTPEEKLKILKQECTDKGLDNLAMVLYIGFEKKLQDGFKLKPHDVRFIEDMWEDRK